MSVVRRGRLVLLPLACRGVVARMAHIRHLPIQPRISLCRGKLNPDCSLTNHVYGRMDADAPSYGVSYAVKAAAFRCTLLLYSYIERLLVPRQVIDMPTAP